MYDEVLMYRFWSTSDIYSRFRRATEGRIRRQIGANYKRRVNNGETLWFFAI